VPTAAGTPYLVRIQHASPNGEPYIAYEADFNVPGNEG
jgi:hypothetical protein